MAQLIGFVIRSSVGMVILSGLSQLIDEANKKKDWIKKIAKQKGDPKLFHQQMNRMHQQFIYQFKKFQLSDHIKKKAGPRDIAFLGSTSSGKTSLINNIFKTKHKIGLRSTTSQTNLTYQTEKEFGILLGKITIFNFIIRINQSFFIQ